MRQIPHVALTTRADSQLVRWQRDIDAIPAFADRVAEASRKYKSRNTLRNKTYTQIRTTLAAACGDQGRCQYCEDNEADEIEHIFPKRLFPDKAFRWDNYLYACGPCNGPKNDQYAVFDLQGNIVEVRRVPNVPPTPPPPGAPLLINPRTEDPFAFMELDMSGPTATFAFVPLPNLGSQAIARVDWTIKTLRLNRSIRRNGRRSAFRFCVSHLRTYALDKANGAAQSALDEKRDDIRNMRYPTVFEAMRRQIAIDPTIGALFASIPEALTW